MKNKITLFITFLAGILLLVSCLKDNVGDYWVDELAGKAYATIPTYTLQQKSLQPVAGDVQYSFALNIATDALPTEDITVTLGPDPAAVAQYNTDHAKSFKVFPNVQVMTQSVVIPKGTRTGSVSVKVWGAETLNACDNYISAVSITSAKTASGKDLLIAGNMKTYLLALPISNPFAGDYHCVGYRKHPSLGIFTVDKTETASTVDCKTIRKSGFGEYPYDMIIEVTTNTIMVGGTTCYKVNVTVIDPSTNDKISSGQGQYATFTGAAAQIPIPVTQDVNYYNPVTQTFVLNAFYNAAANRIAYEVLTRVP